MSKGGVSLGPVWSVQPGLLTMGRKRKHTNTLRTLCLFREKMWRVPSHLAILPCTRGGGRSVVSGSRHCQVSIPSPLPRVPHQNGRKASRRDVTLRVFGWWRWDHPLLLRTFFAKATSSKPPSTNRQGHSPGAERSCRV